MNGVESVATNLAQKLVDEAIKEVQYLCCFNSYFQNFETEKNILSAKRREVQKDIDEAKKRNEIHIEDGVKQWTDEADSLIQEDPKMKKKWLYGWCPNCIWQYQRGKKLARMTNAATNLIKRCDFNRVARPAELPGIKYHTSQDFIDFESRKLKFKELVMALEDENYYMIGLQGMGGMGKTTLATQVGKQVEESKTFQKVIFTTVSIPPNIRKIQAGIARQLGLPLEDKREADHSELLWSKISENKEKILIILDDVWEKLNLRDIGIPSSNEHRECCVLVTTRNSNVCGAMGCQRTIRLETLNYKDALNLFLIHAIRNDNSFSSDLERMALDIVKKCGGLPVVIVALANTLKNWPTGEWKLALTTIRNSEALDDVDEDLMEVYNCLSLSYKNLRNEKARKLFLLCSLFPENYEIPINLFIRLGIGAGIFGDVDKYYKSKRQALGVKNELIASSLLKVEKDCVKMDDLVRDMALRIAKEDIQVIMDSVITLKANKRFLFWIIDDFPDQFDGTKLEIIFLWINGKVLEKNPDAFFSGMTMLKVMFLLCKHDKKHFPLLLSESLLSLKNIRTVILNGWKLDDLSVLRNLQSLETLELENCLIIELPIEIRELNKLRLLGLRKCKIERHNPFEVIKRCSQLEELYFVENNNVENWKPESDRENMDEVAHGTSLPELQMYFIACSGLDCFKGVDNGLLKCFNTKHVRNLISDAMFRHLVGRAEVLEFGEMREKEWKSLIPDIVPIKDGSLNDLMKLYLYYMDDIECLIHTSIDYDVTVFSKLVELHLYHVNVKELCQGPMPSNFLNQLQILILRDCGKLHNIFSDGNLNLPYLKTLELHNCPMFQSSLFQPSVAQTLERLEELIIINCERLKSIITYESSKEEMGVVDKQKSYGILFPKLKSLRIETCVELEWISPLLFAGDFSSLEAVIIRKCMKLEYIFGEYRDEDHDLKQEIMLPSLVEIQLDEAPSLISILRDDSKKKHANSKTRAFAWAHGCFLLPTTKDVGIVVSNHTLQHHENSQKLCTSMKGIEAFHAAECLLRQPLKLQTIKEMDLYNCSKLKSLFTISIATVIMLEKLKISWCDELKHILSNEGEDYDHINYSSIFPKLEEINVRNCSKLEFLFPSTSSGGLEKLKSIDIEGAFGLKYVFGGYNHANTVVPIELPALEILSLIRVPKIISMCAKNYVLWPSLHNVTLMSCWQLMMRPFPDLMVCLQGRQLNLETGYQELIRRRCSNLMACLQGRQPTLETREALKKMIMDMQNLTSLEVGNSDEIKEIFNVEGIESEGQMTLSLQSMRLKYLRELRHIYKDPNNILSLRNLEVVVISGCDELTAILSTSTLKSLPRLTYLEVIDCRDLVHIIEDDCERRVDDHWHQLCFPMLEQIRIYHCYKMRSLFSISTSGILPKLEMLEIEAASMLEEVFRFQQDDTQEMVMENVFPNLSYLRLIDLPKLTTICGRIHFLSVPNFEVFYCPRYGENEAATKELQSAHSNIVLDSENQGKEQHSTHSNTGEAMTHMGEAKREQEMQTPELTCALPNVEENFKEATKKIIEEVSISKISAMGTKGTLMEIQAKDTTPALEKQASETLVAKSKLIRISLHELEDEHIISETTAQLQHQDLGETKTTIEASHQINIPFDDDSINAILKERVKEGPTSEDVVAATLLADLGPRNSSTALITPLQEEFSLIYEETEKEVGKVALVSKLPARTASPNFEDASMKGTVEQGFQEHDASEEATMAIQSTESELMKQSRVSSVIARNLETSRKEVARIVLAPELSMATTSNITQSITETMKQGLQENYAIEDAIIEVQSASSDSRKQHTGPFVNLSGKYSAHSTKEATEEIVEEVPATDMSPTATPFELESKRTTKETSDISVQERPKSDKATQANLFYVIPSLHHESQIGIACRPSPILDIGEILELIELKDGEAALLTEALELYPQLRLCREQRTHPIIAFSYRVLLDILVMLATKTPYTIIASDKLTLEANLGAATFLGFDKDWVESIRAKVFGFDMSDVLGITELEILVMEAELETCEIALEQITKQREDAKERLTVLQQKYREIISAKDRPFGL